MKLKEILNNTPKLNHPSTGTDKNSTHNYIEGFYEANFASYQNVNSLSLLEIGVNNGGSLYLWNKYFVNGNILGIDIIDNLKEDWKELNNTKYIITDAYNSSFVEILPQFDIIIDDGPHSLESQIFFLENYLDKVKPNGLLIIEDIQNISDTKI